MHAVCFRGGSGCHIQLVCGRYVANELVMSLSILGQRGGDVGVGVGRAVVG